MIPIQDVFKLASATICFCKDSINTRRDTLFYGATSAAAAAAVVLGHPVAVPIFLGGAANREFMRSYSWGAPLPQPCLVGEDASYRDSQKNGAAASVVASGLISACAITLAPLNEVFLVGLSPFALVGGVACLYLAKLGATLRDIPALYFDKDKGMWNWPSRGNGPPPKQKFKDTLSDILQECVEANAEQGRVYTPVPVPVNDPFGRRRSNLQCSRSYG